MLPNEERIIEVPAPLGEAFFHRFRNGKLDHHEAIWKSGYAYCDQCGIRAKLSWKPLNLFLRDKELMAQFTKQIGEANGG